MENTIKVKSAEVAMDISLEDEMENCRTKISHWSRIINQFVPSVMSELVWILFVVANVIVKVIINASFYHHTSYIILLRVKWSIHTPIARLPMFLIMFTRKGKIVWKVVWIECYLRLNLCFWRYLYPGYLSIHQMQTLNQPGS